MPVFKDLEDLINNLIKKEEERLKKIRREIEKEIKEVEESIGFSREPLYTMRELMDEYEYIIDIPKADLQSLKVDVVKDMMRVECMTKSGGRYFLRIRLPPDIDPGTANIRREKWLIIVTLKKHR
ncbi:hypothetical protein SUSAZ_06630 [Sulfolobus acidocaldarius SUSAZ]|nr:hypothetical protein SUSAZ_06630 [Sulfolobus acidocaldarius SUSAZ]